MAEILKPDMTNLWASGGASIAPSESKIQIGWTPEIPPHQWQNWWQFRVDSGIGYMFQHGIPEWDAATEYFSGKSFVQHNGEIYKCILGNINQQPDTNPTYWEILLGDASTSAKGLIKLATTSQAQSLTDDATAITPKKLSDAFKGSNQLLGASGYQKLPGGLILQWGQGISATSGYSTHTFPIAFPNAPRVLVASASGLSFVTTNGFVGKTGCSLGTSPSGGVTLNYLVIGD